MKDFSNNLIYKNQPIKQALEKLNELSNRFSLVLFVLNEQDQLVGTITDGDIRRGLLREITIDNQVSEVMNTGFRAMPAQDIDPQSIDQIKKKGVKLLPILDAEGRILRVVDLSRKRSLLPLDAVIMAGGRGERLRPLTDSVPKPLLPVGDKPIIEHNVDWLANYGVNNMYISIKYLGEQLKQYFGDGSDKGIRIRYITEDKALGTIGAVRLAPELEHDNLLVMNSDLLTDIDFEDFFRMFQQQEADMAIATIPYKVNIPYAVLEVEGQNIKSFKEKPTYTYYSNAGIYLIRRSVIDMIPKEEFYNATDLMEELISKGYRVISYPIFGYWLDIGKPEDYKKAQDDIKHLKLA